MLEAMTAGRPVVAAASDGSRYLVQHGVTGLLVPPRDPPGELASAALLEAPRGTISSQADGCSWAFDRTHEVFNGPMVERVLEVWENVLEL